MSSLSVMLMLVAFYGIFYVLCKYMWSVKNPIIYLFPIPLFAIIALYEYNVVSGPAFGIIATIVSWVLLVFVVPMFFKKKTASSIPSVNPTNTIGGTQSN